MPHFTPIPAGSSTGRSPSTYYAIYGGSDPNDPASSNWNGIACSWDQASPRVQRVVYATADETRSMKPERRCSGTNILILSRDTSSTRPLEDYTELPSLLWRRARTTTGRARTSVGTRAQTREPLLRALPPRVGAAVAARPRAPSGGTKIFPPRLPPHSVARLDAVLRKRYACPPLRNPVPLGVGGTPRRIVASSQEGEGMPGLQLAATPRRGAAVDEAPASSVACCP